LLFQRLIRTKTLVLPPPTRFLEISSQYLWLLPDFSPKAPAGKVGAFCVELGVRLIRTLLPVFFFLFPTPRRAAAPPSRRLVFPSDVG